MHENKQASKLTKNNPPQKKQAYKKKKKKKKRKCDSNNIIVCTVDLNFSIHVKLFGVKKWDIHYTVFMNNSQQAFFIEKI